MAVINFLEYDSDIVSSSPSEGEYTAFIFWNINMPPYFFSLLAIKR